jgi:hypothetical protein
MAAAIPPPPNSQGTISKHTWDSFCFVIGPSTKENNQDLDGPNRDVL